MASSSQNSLYANPPARLYTAPKAPDNSKEIKKFYESLPHFAPTRLVSLDCLAKELGVKNVFVKAETERLGLPSFKMLGVSWAIRQAVINRCCLKDRDEEISLEDLRSGVRECGVRFCAATDGNHGRAVARMGRFLGVQETRIFVPKGIGEGVKKAIRGEGAMIVELDGSYDLCVRVAHRWGEETKGGMLIEGTAFDGYVDVPRWTVEGYTTMLLEIDEQLNKLKPTLIVTPCGVGSLAQAIVTHYKTSIVPQTSVLTVEPQTAGSLHESLKAGKALSISTRSSIMTGLECGTISTAAWPVLKKGVDVSVTVSDWEVHEAVLELEREGIKAGPCGAATLAGLRFVVQRERKLLRLDEEAVVVLVCTEGEREYVVPVRGE